MKVWLAGALDALGWLTLASLLDVILFDGFTLHLGGLRLSAHDAGQLAVQLLGIVALRFWAAGSPFEAFTSYATLCVRRLLAVRSARPRATVALAVLALLAGVVPFVAGPRHGLTGRYFDNPDWSGRPFLEVRDPEPGLARTANGWFHENFSVEWTGVLSITQPGEYMFALESDDGATLEMDGELVVDNRGPHSLLRSEGTRRLPAGPHDVRFRFTQTVGGFGFRAAWNPVAVENVGPGERSFTEAALFPARLRPRELTWLRARGVVAAIGETLVVAIVAFAMFAAPRLLIAPRGRSSLSAPRVWGSGAIGSVASWFGRRRAVWVPPLLIAAVLVGVLVVADGPGRGMTGRYYATADASDEPVLVVREPFPKRDRMIYDFTDADGVTSAAWSGVILFDRPGEYHFAIHARTRSRLYVDGALVVDHPGGNEATVRTLRAPSGFHLIRLHHVDDRSVGGPFGLVWSYGTEPFRPFSSADLFTSSPEQNAWANGWLKASRSIRENLRTPALIVVAGLVVWAAWQLVRRVREFSIERPSVEAVAHVVLFGAVATVYTWASITRSEAFWGFAKIGWFEPLRQLWTWLGLVAAVVIVAASWNRMNDLAERLRATVVRSSLPSLTLLVVCAAAVVVFFTLRTGFVNIDGSSYRWMIPAVVSGTFEPSVDEMLERQVHAWLWQVTSAIGGWSVRASYQAASAFAGGLFLAVLWPLAIRLAPGVPFTFMALVLGGGYLQLFFGEVEHYSFVAVAIVAYLLLAVRHIQATADATLPRSLTSGLVAPTAALAVAMSFHMLAGFLLPSLVVLYLGAMRRREFASIALASAAALGVFAIAIAASGLPLSSIYQGSAGTQAIRRLVGSAVSADAFGEGEVNLSTNWAFFRFDAYHWDQYNLLALMFPAHLVLVPLVVWKRVKLDMVNVFLISATAGMAFFQFNYRALLPLAHDWNLFANAAVPCSVLVWRSVLEAGGMRWRRGILCAWLALSWLQSAAWILGNHRYLP